MVDYLLPDELAGELKVPWGPLYPGEVPEVSFDSDARLIAVGDVTHQNILDRGLTPKVAVVDHVTRRDIPHKKSRERGAAHEGQAEPLTLKVTNPAGCLSEAMWLSLVTGLGHPGPVRVEVEGEEDLAALAAVALAPAGTQVAYGQPGEGMVVITVDEALRAKAYELLAKMEER